MGILGKSYMQGMCVTQTRAIPLLSKLPSAQVLHKALASFNVRQHRANPPQDICSLQLQTHPAQFFSVVTLSANPELSRLRASLLLALRGMIWNYAKTRLWTCLASWHSLGICSMLNYMSEQLQRQRYLRVNLQLKLMDAFSAHSVSSHCSVFVVSTISQGQTLFGRRLRLRTKLAGVLAALQDRIRCRTSAKQCLARWLTITSGGALDRRLQLLKLARLRLEPKLKIATCISFQAITQNSAVARTRVNLTQLRISVSPLRDQGSSPRVESPAGCRRDKDTTRNLGMAPAPALRPPVVPHPVPYCKHTYDAQGGNPAWSRAGRSPRRSCRPQNVQRASPQGRDALSCGK